MALTDEGSGNGFYMPVAPAYSGYGNNGGGFFGNDGWWIILLLLCGWGGMGFGGGFGGGMMWPMMMGGGGFGIDYLYPWLNNSEHISDGFRDQMLHTSVASVGDKITAGFGDVATQLCGGFAGVNASINGAQNALAQQMYTNQIADLERSFAAQTAATANASAIQAQLAQCCCDNRAATADLKYTVATENCADRQAVSDGIRDVITAQTANTQAILDKLCALELDGYKRENDQLRSQLNLANLAASQTAQTAELRQSGATQLNQLVSELRSCPIPAQPVYGSQPIFTCSNNGCGCGCNG